MKKRNPEKALSKKSEYYISRARQLELKYFCLQYPEWQAEYNGYLVIPGCIAEKVDHSIGDSSVVQISERREALKIKMDLVIECSKKTDEVYGKYIFRGVTTGLSYDELWKKTHLPMSRSSYYNYYRKFFWILDHAK